MTDAIDYSWARYSGAQLKALGVTDVFRYVGPSAWGKTIAQAEYDDLVGNGLRVWLVFESGSNDSDGGFNAGTANAHTALQYAPTGYVGPIWFAADEALSGAELATAVDYIRGASVAMGGAERTGVYGEGQLCQECHDAGWAESPFRLPPVWYFPPQGPVGVCRKRSINDLITEV